MGDRAAPRVGVEIGDVHGSQLVIGDHNTIQTPEGTQVTVLQVGERPVPRLRRLPVSRLPEETELFGREGELRLVAEADAGAPVQFFAPSGTGKTALLKAAAGKRAPAAEGVVFQAVRRRALDEIQAKLYAAFWECDTPFVPAPAEVGDFLADREALLLLDDCELDRDDLDTLLEGVPRCVVVLASEARTLWARGTAGELGGLDAAAALKLFERELGRQLESEERNQAESAVAQAGGNPQAVIEMAASVAEGRESLADPDEAERRVLAILSALDGAALGTEHIEAVAGIADASPLLKAMQRRGWVKAASPRYRIARPFSGAVPPAGDLLAHMTGWSRKASPSQLADEAEGIEAVLDFAVAGRRWRETLDLSLAAEAGLTVAAAWASAHRVLKSGLRAAHAIDDQAARGFVLHQMGSQSLCLGQRSAAATELTQALQIRESLGDAKGAELTRHNLDQIGGGGGGGRNGSGNGGGGPRFPKMAIALAALAGVAGVLAALALSNGGEKTGTKVPTGSGTGSTGHTTTTTVRPTDSTGSTESPTVSTVGPVTAQPPKPPAGRPPEILIQRPAREETFVEGDGPITAAFTCVAAEGAELKTCKGVVDGVAVPPGGELPMDAGPHALVVTATDNHGLGRRRKVTYTVEAPKDTKNRPPEIRFSIPDEGSEYALNQRVFAQYECPDPDGEKVVECIGSAHPGAEVPPGAPLGTEVPGSFTFTVRARDERGKKKEATVTYTVSKEEEGTE